MSPRRTAVALAGVAALAAAGTGAGLAVSAPRSASAGSSRPAAATPASQPDPGPVPSSPTGAVCPAGGLRWTTSTFSAVPVDPQAGYWMVQERGTVVNRSASAIIVGDGVARVGRGISRGSGPAAVVDLPLTPLGDLVLAPGGEEAYSGAVLVQSRSEPADMGLGLSDSTWAAPAPGPGCPPPTGSYPGPAGLAAATRLE